MELPPPSLPGFLHHLETVTSWSEKKSGRWCVPRAEAALEDFEGIYWALFLSNCCPLEGFSFKGAARRAEHYPFWRGVEKHLWQDENISEENLCVRKTTLKRVGVPSSLLNPLLMFA